MSSLTNTAPFLSTSLLPPTPLTSTNPLNNTLIGSEMPKQPTRNCRKTSRKSPIDGRNANNKRKTKQNKKPDSAYDSSTWETNVYCAVCHMGFWTLVQYLIHIYVDTTHYKDLNLRFKCGYKHNKKAEECGMLFATADECDDHSATHDRSKRQCGEYKRDTKYPTELTRCCQGFAPNASSSLTRHKTDGHSKTWIPRVQGERSKKMNELGFDAPKVPARPKKWLDTPSTPLVSQTISSFSNSTLLEAHFPRYNSPVAGTSYAPAPHLGYPYSLSSDDTYDFAIPPPFWAESGYDKVYSTDRESSSQPSYSLSAWSDVSTSRSPSCSLSPLTCSSIGDSFPPTPAIDSSPYDFSLLDLDYNLSTGGFNNFLNKPAIPSLTDPVSDYPNSDLDLDLTADTSALASYSQYSSLFPQFPSTTDYRYSPLEHNNSGFDNQQLYQSSIPYSFPL